MKIEEFTSQGFKKITEELLPAFTTPLTDSREIYIKKIDDKHYIYLIVKENKSSLGLLNKSENAGWMDVILKLNVE